MIVVEPEDGLGAEGGRGIPDSYLMDEASMKLNIWMYAADGV